MKKFFLGAIVAIILPVFAAKIIWPNGAFLETFQNGFIFGSGKVLSALNDVITFDGKRLDDRSKKIFFQEDFDGASVSFICGTDLVASDESVFPLAGTKSKDFDQGGTAAASGIECAGPTITLEIKEKGKFAGVCFNSIWNGNDNEMALNVYDNTNTAHLVKIPIIASTVAKEHCGYFNIASDTVSIDYDIEVLTGNDNTALRIDDVEFKVDPLTPTDIYASSDWEEYPLVVGGMPNALGFIEYARSGTIIKVRGYYDSGSGIDGNLWTINLPSGLTLKSMGNTTYRAPQGRMIENRNTNFNLFFLATEGDSDFKVGYTDGSASVNPTLERAANFIGQNNTNYTFYLEAPIEEWSDTAQGVVVKNRTDSSSVENVFSARIRTDGTAAVYSESSSFIESVTRLGTGSYAIAFKSGIFTETPAVTLGGYNRSRAGGGAYAMIDQNETFTKNGLTISVYHDSNALVDSGEVSITVTKQGSDYIKETEKVYTVPVTNLVENVFSAIVSSTGVVSNENTDWIEGDFVQSSSNYTGTYKSGFFSAEPNCTATVFESGGSNETVIIGASSATGILLTLTEASTGSANANSFRLICQRAGSDYIAPQGAYLGTFGQPVAYFKDIKPSGTPAGAFPSGSWITRDLTSVEGPNGFSSLSLNQIALKKGSYTVDGWASAEDVTGHKTRLQNITTGTTLVIGESASDQPSAGGSSLNDTTVSNIGGFFILSEDSLVELQHRANSSGQFGRSTSNGSDELYAQIKITKVR